MNSANGMVRMVFNIPTRGLLGYRSQFMTDTKGMGMMNYVFSEYGPYAGDIINRISGVMVVKEPCTAVAYALFNLQERGKLFIHPGHLYTRGRSSVSAVGQRSGCQSGQR